METGRLTMAAAGRVFDAQQAARQVLQIRHWQLLINEQLKQPGRFRIPVHCAIGHEAVAVGVHLAMRSVDRLLATHRNMAFHLARSGSLEAVMLEYELSAAGPSQGRLGSMNLANPARGVVYSSSILGNNLPVACGVAMAMAERGDRSRVYVLTGDGAMEEGAFWESLVFARSHGLNVIFLVENNDHSLASTIAERRCAIDIERLAGSVGLPYSRLAGNDGASYAALLDIGGPAVCEAMVTTFCNHAGATPGWPSDPKSIRLEAGLELEASSRDPVYVARQFLEAGEPEATSRFLLAMAASLRASGTGVQEKESNAHLSKRDQ